MPKTFPALALVAVAALAAGGPARSTPPGSPVSEPSALSGGPAAARGGGVAVVELFTSQGCSSCPPADRLLTRLAADERFRGRVIPLAFHVDYWDYIGWQDPFASPRWSERQRVYGRRAFRTNRIYTPQLVVNGRAECVGSREDQVLELVRRELAREPAARVSLEAEPAGEAGRLRVKVGARMLRKAAAGELVLWVAVFESGLATPVKAGENASRQLRNDRVVRRLERAFALAGTAGAERQAELTIGIDKRWKWEGLGVAAFLQDPETLEIHGGAVAEPEG
jgi:hypothetical protein